MRLLFCCDTTAARCKRQLSDGQFRTASDLLWQMDRLMENLGSANVHLTRTDLNDIEVAFSKVIVQGGNSHIDVSPCSPTWPHIPRKFTR
jgi:hypothetical protein